MKTTPWKMIHKSQRPEPGKDVKPEDVVLVSPQEFINHVRAGFVPVAVKLKREEKAADGK